MQLSEKPQMFFQNFIAILESTLNLHYFEKKTFKSQVFLKLLTLKDMLT